MAETTMRRWIRRWFVFIGAIVTFLLLLAIVTSAFTCATAKRVAGHTILELRLERPITEYVPDDPVMKLLARDTVTVRDIVEALDRASDDDRVSGLVAYLGGVDHGIAVSQEIRDAVGRFRQSGKFAVAFAESFGEFGPGNQGYYLATAFDEIWLQPSGDIGLTGLIATSPFVKGTLELLDVPFRGDHRKQYKNALNLFTERRYTDAHKEATQTLMNDQFTQLVVGIAEGRKLEPDAVRALIDGGPYLGQEAVDHRLVDKLGYRDEVLAHARELANADDVFLLYLERYLDRAGRPHERGRKIALIYGVGGVTRGQSGFDPLFGGPSMGSDTVTMAFREAIEDDDIKAILFRVDSPGGSYVASDAIWREVVRAREAGKPVIVSMGNVAGSGGYFVAMRADKIVAQPGTITGSIGVLGGKPVLRALWNKLGVTFDSVSTSRNAEMWSELHDYDAEEWARFQAWLDRVYEDFTAKAAEGRGLTRDQVEEVARGRIWSGQRAKEIGLVDALGGLHEALALAKEAAGIEADARVQLIVLPERRGLLEAVLGGGRESSERASAEVEVNTLERLEPFMEQLRVVEHATGTRGVLSMPVTAVGP